MLIKELKKLNKYYTKPQVCRHVIKTLLDFYPPLKDYQFIEICAGNGNITKALNEHNIFNVLQYDIQPDNNNIIKQDFLSLKITDPAKKIIITNPPYGKNNKTAINFLNKALNDVYIVCMILPITFKKYNTQKHINKDAKLIYSEDLPRNAFLLKNNDYNLNSVMQVWVNEHFKINNDLINNDVINLRVLEQLPHKHTDFLIYDFMRKENRGGRFEINKIISDYLQHTRTDIITLKKNFTSLKIIKIWNSITAYIFMNQKMKLLKLF